MLEEDDILPELKMYQQYHLDHLAGKSDDDRSELPENKDAPKNPFVCFLGSVLHSILFIAIEVSTFLRIKQFVAFFAKQRIVTDKYSFEPISCGYNAAYTKLGLVLLAQKDLSGAIHCLDASWRVHPCPHNTSFGLKRALVTKLKDYPEASPVVDQYVRIGKQFVYWPEKWAELIVKS